MSWEYRKRLAQKEAREYAEWEQREFEKYHRNRSMKDLHETMKILEQATLAVRKKLQEEKDAENNR